MELSAKEIKTLKQVRKWSGWVEKVLPLSFQSSLRDELKDVLNEMLIHFELWGRDARSVYGDGALMVTESNDAMTKQLESLLKYNLQQIYIVTAEVETE